MFYLLRIEQFDIIYLYSSLEYFKLHHVAYKLVIFTSRRNFNEYLPQTSIVNEKRL